MDPNDYPPDWREISRRIRFFRAKGRCEEPGCGAKHGSIIGRHANGEPVREERSGRIIELDEQCLVDFRNETDEQRGTLRIVKVILTTAHTCNCSPKCGDESHLKALCQLHHLRLDAAEHRRNSAATRRRKAADRGQGFLIGDIDK
jgi:hypothetical protein